MRKLSLFSGIGGIDLAAHWAGMETVAFCEREPFPQRVLQKNFPGVPIYDDVCTLTKERLEQDGIIGRDRAIDIISAGYPCQPFSHAGQRRGEKDDRHLWPEVARLLQELKPRWFVGENVAGHITLGLDDVLDDLERIGYTAQAFVIPASAVYASHRRDRVFIVGYAERSGCNRKSWGWTEQVTSNRHIQCQTWSMGNASGERLPEWRQSEQSQSETEVRTRLVTEPERSSEDVANAKGGRQREARKLRCTQSTQWITRRGTAPRADRFRAAQSRMGGNSHELSAGLDRRGIAALDALADYIHSYPQPALIGQPQHDWEPPRVATGIKNRAARLKAVGNAVDPLQIYPVLVAIKYIHENLNR